jgi:predicted ATPase
MNRFRSLRIEGWRQFDNVDIELHPRLTVLTGANGAGKTSLLRIFRAISVSTGRF